MVDCKMEGEEAMVKLKFGKRIGGFQPLFATDYQLWTIDFFLTDPSVRT
jgi:hypothetical protein